nr:hypothetical protein [Tanacetum cinerariifolium]
MVISSSPIKADDQAIQTILLCLPEDIYAAVDSCETAQEIWLQVQQMMKGSDIGIQEKKAILFNEWERFTSNEGESIESYYHRFLKVDTHTRLLSTNHARMQFSHPFETQRTIYAAYAKNILIASILATGAKDSLKSIPSSWRYPLTTRRD